jgi:hypothetical protein
LPDQQLPLPAHGDGDGDRMCTLSIVILGCVRKHAGPESIRPMAVMDSGSCCARPGMTAWGITRMSLLEVRTVSRRAYGDGDGDRMCTLSIVIPGCVRKHAGPESMRPMVVMDSGLVLRTPE